jgi:N-acetylglucosaminyl-diphospho-decaprenol L-rhamnosyltransferase
MRTKSYFQDVACIIVHHRRFPEVLDTVKAIQAQGVAGDNILVIDNSDDQLIRTQLQRASGPDFSVCFTENKGYAAAVNTGIRVLAESTTRPAYVLVSTHEVVPLEGSVSTLRACLETTDHAVVAGPTLLFSSGGVYKVWSTGGRLSKVFNAPSHHSWGMTKDQISPGDGLVPRDYLDGAFCLYRFDWLLKHPMPEHYFLYFEETSYHADIRAAGKIVGWCPKATAIQSSEGIPPYFLGRNLQRFQNEHGNTVQRWISVPRVLAREIANYRRPVRERTRRVREILRGWRDA